METGHWISPSLRDFLHLRQLLRASGGQIQKRKSIEILRLLIGLLYNLYSQVSNGLYEEKGGLLYGFPV